MKKLFILTIIFALFSSCAEDNTTKYNYPDSKIWKHRVNSMDELRQTEKSFDGVEVDIIYSSKKNDIYVAHGYEDTVNKLFFDEYLSALEKPEKMYYWIDFKNLNKNNAPKALEIFGSIVDKYNIRDKVIIESNSTGALKIAKENNFHVMLWVEAISYRKNPTFDDTLSVIKKIRSKIELVEPDAISCVYTMFPILCDSFPNQNIHFWDTQKKFTPDNVEHTKNLCRSKNVKIVLVDYPEPIDY